MPSDSRGNGSPHILFPFSEHRSSRITSFDIAARCLPSTRSTRFARSHSFRFFFSGTETRTERGRIHPTRQLLPLRVHTTRDPLFVCGCMRIHAHNPGRHWPVSVHHHARRSRALGARHRMPPMIALAGRRSTNRTEPSSGACFPVTNTVSPVGRRNRSLAQKIDEVTKRLGLVVHIRSFTEHLFSCIPIVMGGRWRDPQRFGIHLQSRRPGAELGERVSSGSILVCSQMTGDIFTVAYYTPHVWCVRMIVFFSSWPPVARVCVATAQPPRVPSWCRHRSPTSAIPNHTGVLRAERTTISPCPCLLFVRKHSDTHN